MNISVTYALTEDDVELAMRYNIRKARPIKLLLVAVVAAVAAAAYLLLSWATVPLVLLVGQACVLVFRSTGFAFARSAEQLRGQFSVTLQDGIYEYVHRVIGRVYWDTTAVIAGPDYLTFARGDGPVVILPKRVLNAEQRRELTMFLEARSRPILLGEAAASFFNRKPGWMR